MALPTNEEREQMRREEFMRRQDEQRRQREDDERRERERWSPNRTPDNYNNDPRIWGC